MTNSQEITISDKKQLVKAFTAAMITANKDRASVGEYFKEESFRYITITEISKLGKWGTFPNDKNKAKLVFEFNYKKYKKKNNPEKFIPDIVSFTYLSAKKEKDQINPHFAIELKVKDSIESIQVDLKHCKEYIKDGKGIHDFKLAVCLILNPYKAQSDFLDYARLLFSKRKSINSDSKLLFGLLDWKNEKEATPVLFWL